MKQALNHELNLKKVDRVIQFNQNVWLKPRIEINTDLRKKQKNDCEKDFSKVMNNVVSEKTIEKARKHTDITLVTIERTEREEDICCQNQIIRLQFFLQKIY